MGVSERTCLEQTFERRSMRVERYQTIMSFIDAREYPEQPKEMLDHDWLWEITKGCWEKDPGKRPGAQGLLNSFRTS